MAPVSRPLMAAWCESYNCFVDEWNRREADRSAEIMTVSEWPAGHLVFTPGWPSDTLYISVKREELAIAARFRGWHEVDPAAVVWAGWFHYDRRRCRADTFRPVEIWPSADPLADLL